MRHQVVLKKSIHVLAAAGQDSLYRAPLPSRRASECGVKTSPLQIREVLQMNVHRGNHHSTSLSVCSSRHSRGCARCGSSGSRLMKSSRRMPIFDISSPAGAGGARNGHLDRHVHAAIALQVGRQPFIGEALVLAASLSLRRAAPQRKNELKSGDFGGSVLTLSATLRTWEARGPSNSATADTMGLGFPRALLSVGSNSRPERSQLLMATFFGAKRQCMTYLDPY